MKTTTNEVPTAGWSLALLAVLCLVLAPLSLQAAELSQSEVQAAVQTWVRFVTADAKPDAVIEAMEAHQVEGKTVAYIAHISGGGYCLCGADDLVLPVYLYCWEGTYDPENPACQYILWEIGARTESLTKGLSEKDPELQRHEAALASRASFWQELIAGGAPVRAKSPVGALGEPDQMQLDLTTRWHQDPPYNNSCPMGDGGRCVVGCVATAMVQIMRYWSWPASGVSSRSYTWDGDQSCGGNVGGGTLSATFSDPYDWQNMPDNCAGGCSQAEQDALAELSYEVGVSITMDYGRCGSASDLFRFVLGDAPLVNHFLYDSDVSYGSVLTPPAPDVNTIADEIQWLRPVAFGGCLNPPFPAGGHAWVIYGYNKGTDPNRQFLVNLGWGGVSAWYTLDEVAGCHNNVIQIAPQNMVRFVGNTTAGDGSPDNPHKDIEEAVALAPNEATLILKAGSVNTISTPPLLINRPLTIKGYSSLIR
jgi:hypothetical protein